MGIRLLPPESGRWRGEDGHTIGPARWPALPFPHRMARRTGWRREKARPLERCRRNGRTSPEPRVAVVAPGSASRQSHRGRRPDSGHRRPETAAHGLDPTAVRRPRGPGPCAGRTPGPRPRREREDELSGSRPARQTRPRSHRDRSPPRPRGESLRESCDPKPARASAAPALSDHRSHRTRNDPDGSKHYRPGMSPGRRPTLNRLSSYFTGNGGAAAN